MKKSKKVLLSAAIAAAIMGSVSLPQVEAADIGSGVNLKASKTSSILPPVGGGYDVKTTNPNLDTTLATQKGLDNVNSELADKANDIEQNKNDIKDIKDNMKDSLDKAAQATTNANSAANDAQVAAEKATNNAQMASDAANDANQAADKANQAADNIKSDLDKKVDKDTYNKDKTTIAGQLDSLDNANKAQDAKIKNNAQAAANAQSTANNAQNTANNAQSAASKAQETADGALAAAGTAQSTASAAADAADANTDSINALDGRVTTNESNIAKNTTAIANETNDRVAADTVLSNRITENSSAIQSLRHDVSDLGTEIDNVGAISAALAGLHPLDWNGSGSKFQLSAAAGTYDGKQAMALGGFYHPNRNMMLSLGVSSSLGSDRKTAGNVGITFRVGKGSNGTVSDDVAERLAAMDQKISQLESQNQKLTSILAIVDPSLTKEFPDVPANHWAYEAVSKLAGNGIVEGYPDGDFHGDRTMTRYEMAQVIYKALKKGGSVDQKLVKEFNKEIEAAKANDAQ